MIRTFSVLLCTGMNSLAIAGVFWLCLALVGKQAEQQKLYFSFIKHELLKSKRIMDETPIVIFLPLIQQCTDRNRTTK